MKLFSKTITTTKTDPATVMRDSIAAAIDTALKAGVPSALIEREVEGHAAHFRSVERARIEARQYNPIPVMYDSLTLKPINTHEQIAKAEEQRIARELREQQAAYKEQQEGRVI